MKSNNFAWPVTSISKQEYDRFYQGVQEIRGMIREKPVVIFGAGIRGTLLSRILREVGVEAITFTDNNARKWDGWIDDYRILPPDSALTPEAVVLIAIENAEQVEEQLVSRGYQKDKTFFNLDITPYDDFMEEFVRKTAVQNLILGDCAFTHVAIKEARQESLGEMLQEKLGREHTKLLAVHGMGMRGFYHILKAQQALGMLPEKILLICNLDTFTSKHHRMPRTQHAPLFERIVSAVPNCGEDLLEYSRITKERFFSFHTELYSSSATGQNDRNDRLYMRMNYLYRLNERVEGIEYLTKLLEFAKERQIQVYPFIPPVNYQLGVEFFGEDFLTQYKQNVKALSEVIRRQGFELLNLSFLLDRSEFAAFDTVDETANYAGRTKVAERLATFIGGKGGGSCG